MVLLKLIGKILLLPVVLLLAILRLLVKIGMEVSSFILGALMLIVFGCIIFTSVQHTWNSMGEIISRKTIENSIDNGVAYRIREDDKIVGGMVLTINEETQHNLLDLLFITPAAHSKGAGTAAWQEVERLYPDTKVWETCTPYFETRNIHFYVNKCGFHIVEFFNSRHPDPHDPETGEENNYEGNDSDGMFRYAHFLFSCTQCDRLTKSKENNPEDFYNRFVLSSLYRGYVGHAE